MQAELEKHIVHWGIKGMQWGVRREAKKLAKADAKWEKNVSSVRNVNSAYNKAAIIMNNVDVPRINNKPEYKDHDFTNTRDPLTRQYYDELSDTLIRHMTDQLDQSSSVVSPSGGLKAVWNYDILTGGWPSLTIVPVIRAATHSEDGSVVVDLTWSEDGHILSMSVPDATFDVIAQSSDIGLDDVHNSELDSNEEMLEHYGIKGMQWGVRRQRRKDSNADLRGMSNEQLKEHIDRLRLEQQYSQIKSSASTSAGRKFAAKHSDRIFGLVLTTAASFFLKQYLNKRYGRGTDVASDTVADVGRSFVDDAVGATRPRI
jgi:hypothetical protein